MLFTKKVKEYTIDHLKKRWKKILMSLVHLNSLTKNRFCLEDERLDRCCSDAISPTLRMDGLRANKQMISVRTGNGELTDPRIPKRSTKSWNLKCLIKYFVAIFIDCLVWPQ